MSESWSVDVERNLMFKFPFTMIVAGASGSGKSEFVFRLLDGLLDMVTPSLRRPLRVTWVYGIWQKRYEKNYTSSHCQIIYTSKLPDKVDFDVVVLDDLMTNLGDDKRLSDLFTKKSHHEGISVIFIVQNIFHQGKQMRNVSLNCNYLVLTKNRRDIRQVATLGRQLYKNSAWFEDAYKKAVLDRDYSHLMIDLTPTTEERNRVRSSVTPPEFPIEIFVEDVESRSKNIPSRRKD